MKSLFSFMILAFFASNLQAQLKVAKPFVWTTVMSPTIDEVADKDLCVGSTSWVRTHGAVCVMKPQHDNTFKKSRFVYFDWIQDEVSSNKFPWNKVDKVTTMPSFELKLRDQNGKLEKEFAIAPNGHDLLDSRYTMSLVFNEKPKNTSTLTLTNFELNQILDFRFIIQQKDGASFTANCQSLNQGTPRTCVQAKIRGGMNNFITRNRDQARRLIPSRYSVQFTDLVVYDQRSDRYCNRKYSFDGTAPEVSSDCPMQYGDAENFCRGQGLRLPTAREAAFFAAAHGAKGLMDSAEFQFASDDKSSFERINSYDWLGKWNDSFMYSSVGFISPSEKPDRFWTSSATNYDRNHLWMIGTSDDRWIVFDEQAGKFQPWGSSSNIARVRCVK